LTEHIWAVIANVYAIGFKNTVNLKMQSCLGCWCCLTDCMEHTGLPLITTFN